jgi:hypothetical protein
MTSLETFHVPKPRYEGQDHGTAGTRKGHDRNKFEEDWDNRAHARQDAFVTTESIIEGVDEYFGLTPEQLESVADSLLAKDDAENQYLGDEKYEAMKDLLDNFERAYKYFLELCDELMQPGNEKNAELIQLRDKVGEECEQLQESIRLQLHNNEVGPMIDELGVRSLKARNKSLLNAAKLDYELNDNDDGDFEPVSHMRITSRSPFSK